MERKAFDDLGALQRQVMEVIWELREATVNEVRNRISPDRRMPYTTVLSAMQNLEKEGWLQHRPGGRCHVYKPMRTWEQESVRSLRKCIDMVFRGEPLLLFQHFIRDQNLSDEELQELQKIIREHRKEQRDV